MKRIFVPLKPKKKSEKRKKIEQDALAKLRDVRAQLKQEHPDLLKNIEESYKKNQAQKVVAPKPVHLAPKAPAPALSPKGSGSVSIDREKNLETVARFLQITNSEAVKKMLMKNLH